MEHEVSVDRDEQLDALARHLWGIDFSGAADDQESTIIVQQGAELSEWPHTASANTIIFADAGCVPSIPGSAKLVPTFGEIGADGDELVVNGQLVIETVSFSSAQFLKTTGPTYLSFSTSEDIDALRESAAVFMTDGSIPDCLLRLTNAYEIGGFLGACTCGRGLERNRLTVHRDGLSTSVIGRRLAASVDSVPTDGACPTCTPIAEGCDGDVSMMLGATVLGRKLLERDTIENISGAGWWFDPVVQDGSDGHRRYPLILVRTKEEQCLAMNLGNLRVYRLAEDGARALETLLWLDDDAALSLAGRFGADAEVFGAACDRVLAAVGCRRSASPEA